MVLKILRSRKFSRRLLIGVLILILPAFVMWGIGSLASRPEAVGSIGGSKILMPTFMKSREGVRVQLLLNYYRDINALNDILKNRTLVNYMAWERLILLTEAVKRRINVSNKDVIYFVAQHPLFQRTGVFDKTLYNRILYNTIAIEPRQFEELVRENMKVNLLRQELTKDVTVKEAELDDYCRKYSSKIVFSYIVIDKTPFTKDLDIPNDEISKFFEQNREHFFEPPKAEIEYIASSFFMNPAQKKNIERQFDEIYSELKESPAELKLTADKHRLRYGLTRPFTRDDIIDGVPFFDEFYETAFTLKEGEISRPIYSSTESGTAYILRKTKDIPKKALSFEEAKDQARQILMETKSISMAKEKADELYDQKKESDDILKEIAGELGLKIETAEAVGIKDYIENIGPARQLVLIALAGSPGEVLRPAAMQKGAMIARIDEIIPSDENIFNEEEREALRGEVLRKKQIQQIEEWFQNNKVNVELTKALEEL